MYMSFAWSCSYLSFNVARSCESWWMIIDIVFFNQMQFLTYNCKIYDLTWKFWVLHAYNSWPISSSPAISDWRKKRARNLACVEISLSSFRSYLWGPTFLIFIITYRSFPPDIYHTVELQIYNKNYVYDTVVRYFFMWEEQTFWSNYFKGNTELSCYKLKVIFLSSRHDCN